MPKIPSNDKLRKLMKSYYVKAKLGEKYWPFTKIAWITSGGPVELLISMGITPIYPENHGAMIGAKKQGVELAGEAEKLGYSQDLCSYFRCDVGQSLTAGGPIGGLPKPDFMFCCNNICGTVMKWYEVQARHFDIPMIFIDTPYNYDGVTDEIVQYVKEQFERAIPEIEKATGRRFSEQKLLRVGELANEGITLWNEVLSTCSHVPAPMTCFDAFFYLAPIVTLRGTRAVVDYYKALKKELIELAEKNESAIGEEKFRLVWDNLPIWYKMARLSKTFAEYGACLVGDTYTNAWADNDINMNDPFESMARAYASVYLNRNIESKIQNFCNLIEKYRADGFVMHSNRSCKPYSFGQYDVKDEVSRRTSLPGLMIEADMCDTRAYSNEQVANRIQAFMETLKERKMAS